MISRRTLCLSALACGIASHASAQTYPAKPVKIIVPFAPGGSADVIARLVADQMTKRLGQPFLIENVPGASGNIGTARAATAPADGHTLLAAFSSFAINPSLFPNLTFDIIKDFKPITMAATATHAVVVHLGLKAQTIKDLEAEVKASGGKMGFAHGGVGTPGHLLGELYRMSAGLDIVSVPFNGVAPAITSILGGHTPLGIVALSPAVKHITEGKLRALAVTGTMRAAVLPNVPTMIEAGRPDIVGDLWVGLLAPGKTPDDLVAKLNAEIVAALQTPEFQDKLKAIGFAPVGNSSAIFATDLAKESAMWGKVIRDAKIEATP